MTKAFSASIKTIKAVYCNYFYIELIEFPNSKYCVRWETQQQSFASNDLTSLDVAMSAFYDTLIMIEGN